MSTAKLAASNPFWGVFITPQDDGTLHVGTKYLSDDDSGALGPTLDAENLDELIYQLVKVRRKLRRKDAKSRPGP